MQLLLTSLIAGILTVLAPCILPLLPVILGGSIGTVSRVKPFIVALSLSISIFIFTLLLKGITLFIDIPTFFWQIISGGLLMVIGISMVFPAIWYGINEKLKLHKGQQVYLKFTKKADLLSSILLGAALGPVFSTCSPTYGLIVATVLPVQFGEGVFYILAFCFGVFLSMMAIGYGGRAIVSKLRFAANPNGPIKKWLGVLLILVGIFIITGLDKQLESAILDTGYTGPIEIEQALLR